MKMGYVMVLLTHPLSSIPMQNLCWLPAPTLLIIWLKKPKPKTESHDRRHGGRPFDCAQGTEHPSNTWVLSLLPSQKWGNSYTTKKATTDSISGRAKNKKHQYSFLRLCLLQILSTIKTLNYFSQFKFKSRKIRLGFYQNRSPMTFQ